MTVVSLVFIVLLLLNMPIAYVIGISSCLFFLLEPNVGFSIAAQKMVVSTQSFTFFVSTIFSYRRMYHERGRNHGQTGKFR